MNRLCSVVLPDLDLSLSLFKSATEMWTTSVESALPEFTLAQYVFYAFSQGEINLTNIALRHEKVLGKKVLFTSPGRFPPPSQRLARAASYPLAN